jgi:hypothetical protein
MEGPGFESSLKTSRQTLGSTRLLNNGHRASFPEEKQPRRAVDHPPPSSS